MAVNQRFDMECQISDSRDDDIRRSPSVIRSVSSVLSKSASFVAAAAKENALGFRNFLLRGQLVDFAVGVVIGSSFTALVNAFIAALVTPWIAAIFGSSQFSDLSFYINGSEFKYGNFLNSLLSFILVCLVCYFAVIKPLIALLNSVHGDTLATKFCPECMEKIPKKAQRCKACCIPLPEADEKADVGQDAVKQVKA